MAGGGWARLALLLGAVAMAGAAHQRHRYQRQGRPGRAVRPAAGAGAPLEPGLRRAAGRRLLDPGHPDRGGRAAGRRPARAADRAPDRRRHQPRPLGRAPLSLRGRLAHGERGGRAAGQRPAGARHRLPPPRLAQPPLPGLQPLLLSGRRAARGGDPRALRSAFRRHLTIWPPWSPGCASSAAGSRRRSSSSPSSPSPPRTSTRGPSYLKALDEVATERRARLLDAARAAYRSRFGRDIARVEDLVRGPSPLLRRLPPAHPHFPGFEWELDPETRRDRLLLLPGALPGAHAGARSRAARALAARQPRPGGRRA